MNFESLKPAVGIKPDIASEGGDLPIGPVEHKARKRARVRVGGIYILGERSSATQVQKSVAASADMLDRLAHKIVQPGIRLEAGRDIPFFFVDPDRTGRFLRELNGKVESGVLENGDFKVVD